MKALTLTLSLFLTLTLSAQTLFYYGNDSVSAKDFLKAYHKNNSGISTEKSFRDYLTLYINSRLKIREARERGYDTLPQFVADLDNLRQQILPTYLNDKEALNRLVNEAFLRSQKDIHLAHIFIPTPGGSDPSVRAKANAALQELKDGKDFAAVARAYSGDPSVAVNGGDLGWITVFSLPYELENLAYTTPAGKLSVLYQSKAGFHIFKNLGERKDPGRLKAAQILLAFPPGTSEADRMAIKGKADSLYNRLLKGDDFGKLATQFSNDVVSAAASGQIPEFGVGQYDAAFESAAFGLAKDGAITPPFLTTHGYHIVKRLGRTPVPAVKTAKVAAALQSRVEGSDRIETTKTALAQKIMRGGAYQPAAFNEKELYAYSDSALNYTTPAQKLTLQPSSVLFRLGSKTVTVSDWISYAQTFRFKPDGSGVKAYPVLWNEFAEAMAIDYYQNHLEDFNPDFAGQLAEFRDGNLFFEIMQQEIWGPAQADSAALLAYYERNRNQYQWRQSADAVIFYASDLASARTFRDQLLKSPSSWNSLVTGFSEKIAADSSRFESAQLPNPSGTPLRAGAVTAIALNKTDNTASFAYVKKLYEKPEARSFAEARGLVINDYQAALEQQWMASLHKKYLVWVNEKLVEELVKGRRL